MIVSMIALRKDFYGRRFLIVAEWQC